MVKALLPLFALILVALPLQSLAVDESCGEAEVRCSCTDSVGNSTSSTDSSITDGDLCAAYCNEIGSVSYAFFCGEESSPRSLGDISEYLDSIAASIGVETITKEDPAIPALNVPIPGLDLRDSVKTDENGNITSSMLGLYINAVFSYGITLAALFGVLMLTIAGFQYMTAGGDKSAVSKAKDRIQNTIFGLILVMATYCIAFLIDPRTTYFTPLTLKNVEEIKLSDDAGGEEGGYTGSVSSVGGGHGGGGTSWTNLSEPYRTIVETAKSKVSCSIPDLISSPTGKLPNQGKHHWYDRQRNGIYTKINALDWAAPWGEPIYAPFAGTVTYQQQTNTENKCGNRIYLTSSSGDSITICHAKDFTDASGNFISKRSVSKGEVIGHLGGLCCAGQPEAYEVTKCNVTGTLCTDPTKNQNCSCQRITESGNTTGPHVHITFNNMKEGMMLACLE